MLYIYIYIMHGVHTNIAHACEYELKDDYKDKDLFSFRRFLYIYIYIYTY
jgi:hypothetical protein